MKIFGYKKDSEDLLKLEEVTIQCNIKELGEIIDYLIDAKIKHANVANETDMCHSHYRDWNQTWQESEPDIIVVTKFN